jgi:hypothetical protein
MMEIGTQVIRKNYRGGLGVIEQIFTRGNSKQKAYVRWLDALRPFSGGSSDNHSTVNVSALLIANKENLAKQQKSKSRRRLKWAKARWENNKDWIYCSKCKTRIVSNDLNCYRCGPITEIDRWIEGESAKEILAIIEKTV